MKIFHDLPSEVKNVSLALGFFDGVHIAHQSLIKKTIELSLEGGTKSALITFEKSPASIILKTEPIYISSLDERLSLMEEAGLDEVYVLDFNKLKHLDAKEYIENVILKSFAPKHVITGFNHTFGLNKKGNSELLRSYKNKFDYIEIEPVYFEDTLVSSTNVKKAITKGEFELANKMLGRQFSIKGEVVHGAEIARKLGYRTANVIWSEDIIKPKYGVYFAQCKIENEKYLSMVNFGVRPSVDKDLKETLEAHILNFDGNIYGKTLEVSFISKLRDEVKFSSTAELKSQIDKDYKKILTLI